MSIIQSDIARFTLQGRVTKAANYSLAAIDAGLMAIQSLIIVLRVYSAERDSSNETYDLYVTNGPTANKADHWDIVHFPQIATTGAKTFVARLNAYLRPENVTTAGPGVAANETGTMRTETAGSAQGIKALGAGIIRHGPLGNFIGLELVVAGTIATGIDFEVEVFAS